MFQAILLRSCLQCQGNDAKSSAVKRWTLTFLGVANYPTLSCLCVPKALHAVHIVRVKKVRSLRSYLRSPIWSPSQGKHHSSVPHLVLLFPAGKRVCRQGWYRMPMVCQVAWHHLDPNCHRFALQNSLPLFSCLPGLFMVSASLHCQLFLARLAKQYLGRCSRNGAAEVPRVIPHSHLGKLAPGSSISIQVKGIII